jgi:hypothetical protein
MACMWCQPARDRPSLAAIGAVDAVTGALRVVQKSLLRPGAGWARCQWARNRLPCTRSGPRPHRHGDRDVQVLSGQLAVPRWPTLALTPSRTPGGLVSSALSDVRQSI